MYKIYKIVDNTNNNVYVGQTKDMRKRMNLHRCFMKSEKYYCSSKIVLKNNDYTLEIIEDNLSEEESIIKEKYYIQNTPNCINALKYTFNKKVYHKEYNKKNKEKILEKQNEYRENNREMLKIKQRNYYEKNREAVNERKRENRKIKKVVNEILDDIITQIELDYS